MVLLYLANGVCRRLRRVSVQCDDHLFHRIVEFLEDIRARLRRRRWARRLLRRLADRRRNRSRTGSTAVRGGGGGGGGGGSGDVRLEVRKRRTMLVVQLEEVEFVV